MYVYLIGAEGAGPLKIGITNNLQRRLVAFQTASHLRLQLLSCAKVDSRDAAALAEATVHTLLIEHRINGEWFSCSADIAKSAMVKAGLQLTEPPRAGQRKGGWPTEAECIAWAVQEASRYSEDTRERLAATLGLRDSSVEAIVEHLENVRKSYWATGAAPPIREAACSAVAQGLPPTR